MTSPWPNPLKAEKGGTECSALFDDAFHVGVYVKYEYCQSKGHSQILKHFHNESVVKGVKELLEVIG